MVFLDELHAHDPGDARMLTQVILAVTVAGEPLLATSNYPPDGLLPDPREHRLALPLVTARRTCTATRQHSPADQTTGVWVTEVDAPGGPAAGGCNQGTPRGSTVSAFSPPSPATGRASGPVPGICGLTRSTRLVQVGWDELCGGTSSVGDLADLTVRYPTLVLARVPCRTASTPDERRRSADLVDVC